jgi:hypothetical protein
MDSFKKQPYEEFTIEADFSANMEDGETVSTVTATAIIKDGGSAAVVADATPIGQTATAMVSGGEPGSSYIITFQATTTAGSKWELDVKMSVTA